MCQHVIDRFNRYFEQRKVQPYYAFEASKIAGEEMDLAPIRFARYLNVNAKRFCLALQSKTHMLARACLERLVQGDAIIVSAQEHEANSGVWRKLADYGIDVRIWCVDPNDGATAL